MTLIHYEHPEVVPIIDKKVTIFIPEYELEVVASVRQTKGKGTADADDIVELNHYHRDMIAMLLKNPGKIWDKYRSIITKMKIVKHIENPNYHFIENNWNRPCSELLRKGILRHHNGHKTKYFTDFAKANRALETGKFE